VVAVEDPGCSVDALEALARGASPPVLGYIRGGRFKLDVRTLTDAEISEAATAISAARRDARKG
jgi:hypothetical protein